ncbi:MAG: hypothetical protein J6D18_00795, partial [Erysipelotrichaceae bacterium]|nr:hypothetical protein [Erysipelotrichaceae bacterium]
MKQSCTIKKQSDFSEYDLSCLFLLYYPLIGMEAVILYGVLRSLQGNVAVEQIRIMTDLSDNRLTHARKQLEQYQLLETYYHPQEESWIYELKAPLSSYEFLRHDSFSRLFLQKVGSGRFDRIKAMLDQGEMIPSGYQNISEMIN